MFCQSLGHQDPKRNGQLLSTLIASMTGLNEMLLYALCLLLPLYHHFQRKSFSDSCQAFVSHALA